jgi:hypothetical protein
MTRYRRFVMAYRRFKAWWWGERPDPRLDAALDIVMDRLRREREAEILALDRHTDHDDERQAIAGYLAGGWRN